MEKIQMIKPLPMPERRVSEAAIETYLRKRVTALGGECYKWTSPQVRGVFDRVCVFPGGAIWFVELKAQGGKMSKLQGRFLNRMIELGCDTCTVLWSKEQIDNWLKGLGYE